ncbi:hypothetical protein KDL01_32500 [Actinospica durhamensis]|uniref:Uncharacterized protein n=1 Tax=Actinospica durhamensis TaxID=1508375 RepID=A0A941F0H0_9ACTN|nr:hypothetical protein [Actinospica durhamensis]MBR7838039.1 hypothetical protein [Actinospica durhamensis]
MDDHSRPQGSPGPPNAVLRGGPFDGKTLVVDELLLPLAIGDGGRSPHFVYRPTGEPDEEYPTLMRYELDHAEGT